MGARVAEKRWGSYRQVPDVARLRKTDLRLTQQQFASLMGFSYVSVNRWENKHATPTGLSFVLLHLLREAVDLNGAAPVVHALRKAGPGPLALTKLLAAAAEGRLEPP